jgi:hypothetical protein
MKRIQFAHAAILAGLAAVFGCGVADNTPVGKGVKTYERYSDELGKERDVKFFGKDIVVEPEADRKIRIAF